MRYCADTWFLLMAFARDSKAVALIEETKKGKVKIIIPVVVFAETVRKLMQRGASRAVIDMFFSGIESSEKIEITIADKAVAAEAAQISLSYNIPLIDSFVAATHLLMECDILLSADTDYALLVKRKHMKVQSW